MPESVYLRLRNIPENQLPIHEQVLIQVWEMIYPFKKENEMQRKEIFALREEIKNLGDKHVHLLNEIEHQ